MEIYFQKLIIKFFFNVDKYRLQKLWELNKNSQITKHFNAAHLLQCQHSHKEFKTESSMLCVRIRAMHAGGSILTNLTLGISGIFSITFPSSIHWWTIAVSCSINTISSGSSMGSPWRVFACWRYCSVLFQNPLPISEMLSGIFCSGHFTKISAWNSGGPRRLGCMDEIFEWKFPVRYM